jgi:hypothetical protein
MSADLTQGFQISPAPENYFVGSEGRSVTVEAWVYNLTTAGLARVGMLEGGTGAAVYQPSYQANVWERILVTFYPNASATAVTLRFTGVTGTVYWDGIKITLNDYVQRREVVIDNSATPSVSYGGYQIPLCVTLGTPTYTNFLEPHVGIPFTIRGASAAVCSDNANIFLSGSASFTFAVGDTLTLVYGSDGVFHEIARTHV